ncbi:MAG: SRPBCC family protein [Nocardioides sp.]
MPFTVEVVVEASAERAYAYLADPRNRPAWQSSLRRIESLSGEGEAGSTWVDVTAAGCARGWR